MKVKYKNKIYFFQWPKEFNDIIFRAAKKYRYPKSGFINWRKAEAEGALKGLPKILTLRDISHRFSFLKFHNTEGFRERKNELNRAYLKRRKSPYISKTHSKRVKLFKEFPVEYRMQYGWKPKKIWTEKQKQLLITLTKKYRKSAITIDWKLLVLDSRVKKLPYQDPYKLMKYYGQKIARKLSKRQLAKKRKDAIRYKNSHYKKYRNSQKKRFGAIKNSVNNFLLSQLIRR